MSISFLFLLFLFSLFLLLGFPVVFEEVSFVACSCLCPFLSCFSNFLVPLSNVFVCVYMFMFIRSILHVVYLFLFSSFVFNISVLIITV